MKKNKFFLVGLPVIALVLGMMVAGKMVTVASIPPKKTFRSCYAV